MNEDRRWEDLEASIGSINDQGHDRDDDSAEWVRSQRSDGRRSG